MLTMAGLYKCSPCCDCAGLQVRGLKGQANALTDEASQLRYKLSQARSQQQLLKEQIVEVGGCGAAETGRGGPTGSVGMGLGQAGIFNEI